MADLRGYLILNVRRYCHNFLITRLYKSLMNDLKIKLNATQLNIFDYTHVNENN